MTTIDRIRAEIKRLYGEYKAKFHQNGDSYHLGIIDGLDMAERILDTLPDESEQPTKGYDEAYLNEKIAKASKSWKGVDVDKFMDEVRGRELVTDCNDLEEAAENPYVLNDVSHAAFEYERTRNDLDARSDNEVVRRAFIAGAEWQKRKMMEGAVEGEVQEFYRDEDGIHCCVSVGTDYKPGTIVYVITIPKEDEQ